MSLLQGQIALSFGVILMQIVQEYSIQASLINKPTYRLTYEDVDDAELGAVAKPGMR